MGRVVVGMDPHKCSATIEVSGAHERVLAAGRFGTGKAGYAEMLAAGREYPDRVWAVEGCNGAGRHLAHRLVHDGETVVDVPARLSARQARALTAATKPRDIAGKTRRRLAVEMTGELEGIDEVTQLRPPIRGGGRAPADTRRRAGAGRPGG